MCKSQIGNRQAYASLNPVTQARDSKLFETLMEETSNLLNCEASQLLILDPQTGMLKTKCAHNLPLREFAADEDIMGAVCSTGRRVCVGT